MSTVELREVARYYVKCEQGKNISICLRSKREQEDFDSRIDALGDEELKQEVQRLSEERNNEIYRRLYLSPQSWHRMALPASALHLPQINRRVNPYLERAGWELARFADMVRTLSAETALVEFKDDGRPVCQQNLLVLSESGRYRIIDGSHRAVAMCLRGTTTFPCFVGS